jgi:uncharacterized protein (DUF58 family)
MGATGRSWALVVAALLLYFSANQTQVGWLYVMAALTAGAWLAGRVVSPGRMLRRVSLIRRINGVIPADDLELYAGRPVTIELELKNAGRLPALQVRAAEACPFASAADRDQPGFVSVIPPKASVRLGYTLRCARRGWFEFPPVLLSSRAPVGLFAASRALPLPTQGLVFPEYRELESFPLLDQRPAAETTLPHAGLSGEVLGVREYRPGDSRRHIHWRSSARAGRLMVKEFAEESQPGLTIALDLRAASVVGADENTSLELAVKAAATLARYAARRGLPVTLAANSARWPAPAGPLTWWGLMTYLAQVQGEGAESFADCLSLLGASPFVAAILTAPDEAAASALAELHHRGQGALAVVIDPAPFGGAAGQAQTLAGQLSLAGVEVRVIGAEPNWEELL